LAVAYDDGIRWYGYCRKRAATHLLEPAPNVKVDAHEMERRQKLFDRVFALNHSDMGKLSTGAAIETWGTVAEALGKEPDLAALNLTEDMSKAHAAAVNASQSHNREVDEDSAAMNALRAARGAFDRAARAYARMVEGVLVHEGKESELGRYVLARDPAYAARRSANVPITEEPGADAVDEAP
jgi:hypothetical protein